MAKKRNEDKKASAADKKPLDLASVKDAFGSAEVQDSQVEYIEGNEDASSKGSSLMVNSGYNPKRNEFEPEYDHNIEQPITDMEFKDSDTKAETELKLRMLHIYNQRFDERVQRKNFVLERNLLKPDPLLKDLSPEEKEIYDRYNVFMRFHSKEEREELIRTVIEEHRLIKSVKALHEAKRAGCSTLAEVEIYTEQKKTMEAEESSRKENESADVVPSGVPTEGQASTYSLDSWDIMGFPGSDLLSENDKRLCCEMKMLPSIYLKMQEDIATLIFSGQITKRSDAYPYFRIERYRGIQELNQHFGSMGRSIGFLAPADGDSSQRPRRRRATSSRKCEAEANGGKRAFYHCNYCDKDITGKIRIKYALCPDFDLCVECFSVGAEVAPHKSNHPYRVMDNLSFPLLSPDWNADEEILLLEGIEMYGLENWEKVAEHVGTKSCAECNMRYRSAYLDSPYFLLPDMTCFMGKDRSELLAMAKEQDEGKKDASLSIYEDAGGDVISDLQQTNQQKIQCSSLV